MKTRIIACTLLVAGAAFAQFSIGVRIGAPPPERIVRVQPRSPGNGYTWIAGYWYPVGHRYKWHEGDQGKSGHDHRSDRDRNNRDFKHDRN